MTIKSMNAYRCNTCWSLYRLPTDAEECCPPEVVEGWDCGRHDATAAPVVTRSWMTPRRLDVERITYRRMKPQHGGWNQALWLVVQDTWWRAQ